MACFDKNKKNRQAKYLGVSGDAHQFEAEQLSGVPAELMSVKAGKEIDSKLKGKEGLLFDISASGKVKI